MQSARQSSYETPADAYPVESPLKRLDAGHLASGVIPLGWLTFSPLDRIIVRKCFVRYPPKSSFTGGIRERYHAIERFTSGRLSPLFLRVSLLNRTTSRYQSKVFLSRSSSSGLGLCSNPGCPIKLKVVVERRGLGALPGCTGLTHHNVWRPS
jgi:hypothetical protein